jgi:hypothetical protein
MGNRDAAPLILNIAVNGIEWSTSGPARFIPAKERRYPLNRQLGGSGHVGEEKSILPIPVAPRSKAWVSNCLEFGFESRREHGNLSVVCCQVERSLRLADQSFRGVLPSVRACVIECDRVQQ